MEWIKLKKTCTILHFFDFYAILTAGKVKKWLII
jgi:hypothetical protein